MEARQINNLGLQNDLVWRPTVIDAASDAQLMSSNEGPLKSTDKSYKGSIRVGEWEITSKPLSIIAADDPVACAIYAKERNLLDIDGWKRFKTIAQRHKKMFRMANQAKLRSYRTAPKYNVVRCKRK